MTTDKHEQTTGINGADSGFEYTQTSVIKAEPQAQSVEAELESLKVEVARLKDDAAAFLRITNENYKAFEKCLKKIEAQEADVEKAKTDQPQQPTAREMYEEAKSFMQKPMQDLEDGTKFKLDTKDIYEVGLFYHLEQWLKDKTKER